MYCVNCGKQIPDGSKFCPFCGADQETEGTETVEQPASSSPQGGGLKNVGAAPAPQPPKEPFLKSIIDKYGKTKVFAAVGVIAAVIILVIVGVSAPKTIDLDQYLTVDYSGYDGYGVADYDFDTDTFLNENASKMKLKGSGAGNITSTRSVLEDVLAFYTDVSLDKSKDLSNGDKITVKWVVNAQQLEAVENQYHVKFKYKDREVTVANLQEVDKVDVFSSMVVDFSGISGNGTAEIDASTLPQEFSSYYFTVDPSRGLSNGDVVTVSVNENNIQEMAESFGKVPESSSKEFTVSGLEEYLTTAADLTDDDLAAAKSQAEDLINSKFANEKHSDGETILSIDYLGYYFLIDKSWKEDIAYGFGAEINYIDLVYKVTYHVYDDEKVTNDQVYYAVVSFPDWIKQTDGTITADVMDGSIRGDSVYGYSDDGSKLDDYFSYRSHRGYENLNTAFDNLVTKNLDGYSYESTVTEN